MLDLVELSYLLEAKIESLLELGVHQRFREIFIDNISHAYGFVSCKKLIENFRNWPYYVINYSTTATY